MSVNPGFWHSSSLTFVISLFVNNSSSNFPHLRVPCHPVGLLNDKEDKGFSVQNGQILEMKNWHSKQWENTLILRQVIIINTFRIKGNMPFMAFSSFKNIFY